MVSCQTLTISVKHSAAKLAKSTISLKSAQFGDLIQNFINNNKNNKNKKYIFITVNFKNPVYI